MNARFFVLRPAQSRLRGVSSLLLALLAGAVSLVARERMLFNDDWRFHRGDPVGTPPTLSYDVRPAVTDQANDRPADAKPEEADALAAAPTQAVLKAWILPTGNALIKDPAKHHVRPEGNPGGDLPWMQANFDARDWQPVTLPHDWAIAGPFTTAGGGGMGRLPSDGVGWYRKTFTLPASAAGQQVYLEFEGAMAYASVWLNGRLLGGWPYGYTSWQVELTPHAIFGGENQLVVRLDNPPVSSRWYPGAGLYRNVWLTQTAAVHVAQWGTKLTTPKVSPEAATVSLAVTLDNTSKTSAQVRVATDIYSLDAAGRRTGPVVATMAPRDLTIPAEASASVENTVTLTAPKLWGPPPAQQPNRYVAVTTVFDGDRVLDTYETPFGLRDVRFDVERGILVNGQTVRIQGVNQHHDLGALGAAFNRRAAERQLEVLRELGCNAVRLSHNPPAPELLELMDQMGFLVIDEAFDIWERKKTPLDAHLIFPDWHEQDLRALVRRDRHHPSVILWSIGNEVGEQYTDAAGASIAKRLRDIVYEEDGTRPVTSAMNYAKPDMPLPAELDVINLNYQGEGIRQDPEFEGTTRIRTPPQYPAFREKFPAKLILSSETASAFSSRGVYLFPVDPGVSAPVRDGRGGDSKLRQVSAYELHAVDFGSSADKVFTALDRHPYVAGEFVWTGWDYLGEPTPYDQSRSSYCGIIDLAGFKKDRFFLYQSRWRPELPMAHLLPHWTWPERVGQVTPVHLFTSGDEAELFLNGRSLGRKTKGPHQYRLRWDDVVYEPGKLEVVAYKGGREWARNSVETAGSAAALELQTDRAAIETDGRDLAFITARVVDAQGRLAPRADPRITFTVEGPGELVATDNGDATSVVPFPSAARPAFNGLCLAIVRAKSGAKGVITVTANADGLRLGGVSINGPVAPAAR